MENTKKPEREFSGEALAAIVFDKLALPSNATIRVAFSGGVDSTALLAALCEIRRSTPIRLSAVHVDHGLHVDSGKWAEHCRRVGEKLDVPVSVRIAKVTTIRDDGVEGAARLARYAALKAELSAGECLFLGHHRDDQAETVLLQLFRGTGIHGLAAMPEIVSAGQSRIVRPLLGFSRAALQKYAALNQLCWVEDPSNDELKLRRNFIRHRVGPVLGEMWPGWAVQVPQVAHHAADALEILDDAARNDLSNCMPSGRWQDGGLSVSAVVRLSGARRRNLLRFWLRRQGFGAPSSRVMREIEDQLSRSPECVRSCIAWSGCEIWRYRDLLIALRAGSRLDLRQDLRWNPEVPFYHSSVGGLVVQKVERATEPALRHLTELSVRRRCGGERLRLPGRTHHSALKKLIQQAGIPPWERASLPLLYAGERLVAVADRWVDAEFAAGIDEPGYRLVWRPPTTDAGLAS